ncbi:uncharacterized protein LOC102808119 [Saccoglossus kowalevskii]|uniref:Ankyrin repeat domain-containing protein 17-like n=1 Tax=Saccoglossus kowalevskii TaxID=10224 RepID=A0ABM0MUZ4_SACKO|nr:PREDICTED: ankyrin repeat domain-containing protein 17-like [Saccoglossus kowalevskii]
MTVIMNSLIAEVKKGNIEGVESILKHSDNCSIVNFQDTDRRETALFTACAQGFLAIVQLLISFGANLGLYTVWGATPLHAAAENGHEQIVRFLVPMGASINAQTHYGDSPLHLAAFRGHLGVVRYLVECGANVTLKNVKWKTATEEATLANYVEISTYLRSKQDEYKSSTRVHPELNDGNSIPNYKLPSGSCGSPRPLSSYLPTSQPPRHLSTSQPPRHLSTSQPPRHMAINNLSKDDVDGHRSAIISNIPIADGISNRRQPVESLDPSCLPPPGLPPSLNSDRTGNVNMDPMCQQPPPPHSFNDKTKVFHESETTLLHRVDEDSRDHLQENITTAVSELRATRQELENCHILLKSSRDREMKILEDERRLRQREVELVESISYLQWRSRNQHRK